LLEALVAIGIFMFAMGAMFVLFQKAYQSYHFLEQRQSVQSQVLRITGALEADFRVTHLGSVGIENDQTLVAGQVEQRDRVGCLSVDDWQDPDNFYPDTGIPRWNQYTVYIASLDEVGTLERVVYRPDPPALGTSLPIVALGGLNVLEVDRIHGRQRLCENLLSWECSLDGSGQMVNQVLRLRGSGTKRGVDANATTESFEARFRWVPKNTVPKL
jgi:type II secretory pathway component PulJ